MVPADHGHEREDEDGDDLRGELEAFLARPSPEEEEPDGPEVGHPVLEWIDGQPVPALAEIPPTRWREVLEPLAHKVRMVAAARAGDLEATRRASILATTLDLEDAGRRKDAERRAARPRALPAPTPSGVPGPEASRQVNFRISARQHERLSQAAQRVGAKPGQLARLLTLRGVEHMLWEERAKG